MGGGLALCGYTRLVWIAPSPCLGDVRQRNAQYLADERSGKLVGDDVEAFA